MKAGKGLKISDAVTLIALAVVLPLSVLASVVFYVLQYNQTLRHVDSELKSAAFFARQILGTDYHDGISDRASVSEEELDKIVQRLSMLCTELKLEHICSLLQTEDGLVFTSAVSPANDQQAHFFELHPDPELYEPAFQTMKIQHLDFHDKSGENRAVLIPHYDSHGRKYLFCAEKQLSDIEALTQFLIRNTGIILLIVLVPSLLLAFILSRWLTRPISRLAEAAEAFGQGNYHAQLKSCRTLELNILAKEFTAMRDSFTHTLLDLENALRQLQDFHYVVSNSPIIFYRLRTDEDLSVEFLSENCAVMGYDVEKQRSGKITWQELVHEDDLERIIQLTRTALAGPDDNYSFDVRFCWANGEVHWYKTWNHIFRAEDGTPEIIQGIMMDITDLHEAGERDITYQNRLRALSQDLIKAEDRERRQLAIALHDDIGQMLAALNMKFAVLKESEKPSVLQSLIPQIDELLSRIMHTTKTLTWEISPTSLYETDLGAGLKRMASEIKDFFGLDTVIDSGGTRVVVDKNTSAFIFRCTKELLVNIAKHAGVKTADVGISHYGDKAHLVVADKGCGFDPASLDQSAKTKYGLFSIRERIEHVGGSMRIESSAGKGTKVMLIIPLDIEEILN